MLICPLYMCICFWWDVWKIFDPFFDVVYFSYVEFWVLCIFEIKVFYQICLCQWFLPVCGLPSHSLDSVFCRAEVLILTKSSLLVISFTDCAFGVVCKKLWPNPWSSIFLPTLSSGYFIALHFILRSKIHFELILWRLWGLCLNYYYYFFTCGCPVSVPFVKKTIFSPLYCLCTFVKDKNVFWQRYIYVCLFLGFFLFCPSINYFVNTTLSWWL